MLSFCSIDLDGGYKFEKKSFKIRQKSMTFESCFANLTKFYAY